VRAGELKAKTAALLAGIVKTKMLPEQPHWWQKSTPAERKQFLKGVSAA
jgi:hypothetical protein